MPSGASKRRRIALDLVDERLARRRVHRHGHFGDLVERLRQLAAVGMSVKPDRFHDPKRRDSLIEPHFGTLRGQKRGLNRVEERDRTGQRASGPAAPCAGILQLLFNGRIPFAAISG